MALTVLTRTDLRGAFAFLGSMAEAASDPAAYAAVGVRQLPGLVASELTTLSICHLDTGRRDVVGFPDPRLSVADRACFDRHFDAHPLVRFHGHGRGRGAHRISDSVPFARFRHTALYHEYYRRIGIDHAIALPLLADGRLLVSFVLNRRGRDFSDRERCVLDLVGASLARLFAALRDAEQARGAAALPLSQRVAATARLTLREREVLRWLARGKTDRDIGAILGCSHRTVQKHLQRAYPKLGVETRTAAAMRWLGSDPA